ncbi:acyclic terpene utilization AtuA family protein [Streptomonospora wellingtoniae]|uniref:Acyclic terpene utilization AtuA family protein n=1 Tax=Streptomonospora wellingtoniae TaxID=3075544 RepID=A0ABU2KXU9_9ACTN|nr:acyclic terpene utilization AtuA family protein [Streptomonospora sp. DSM 45055]MDT0304062.1 acyclic terpene utilization AtuA family protein [Streptomonospora sp. DSM 45055]
MSSNQARIGCGAGFAADRIEPAVDLVEQGRLDVLGLECLGERTVALAALRRLSDPRAGYDPMLRKRMAPLLGPLSRTGTRLITNAGAADPVEAARMVRDLGAELGVPTAVAAVTGDDVLDRIDLTAPAWEDGSPLESHGEIVSANAYIGADALLPALRGPAPVVIAGRAADPSLFLAPLAHLLGWETEDWARMAAGTLVGHLLECAGQVTGGYFADPARKPVPGLARLGYPIAEVGGDGGAVITKPPGTGGRVDRLTVAEQLTYEVTDPRAYLTPDVSLDLTGVDVRDHGGDRVSVRGARGAARPDELKVSVGYRAGFRGEGEISYAGRGALDRARLAAEVVRERLAGALPRLRADVVGHSALHGEALAEGAEPYECRLRVAGLAGTREAADAVGEEVSALYTSGPAGGGGLRVATAEVVGVLSATVPREQVETGVVVFEGTE